MDCRLVGYGLWIVWRTSVDICNITNVCRLGYGLVIAKVWTMGTWEYNRTAFLLAMDG